MIGFAGVIQRVGIPCINRKLALYVEIENTDSVVSDPHSLQKLVAVSQRGTIRVIYGKESSKFN